MATILLDVVVDDASAPPAPEAWPQPASLDEAVQIVRLACAAGVSAIRVLDHAPGAVAVDAGTVAAYLSATTGGCGVLFDAATTGNAPYNLARRVGSLHRATGSRAGVVLRPGGGDAVSDLTAPDPSADHPAARWAEYAQVLAELWRSFPAEALVGDQSAAVVVDDRRTHPIDHDGTFYRVTGPLDGPSTPQRPPLLVATDLDVLGWEVAATAADAILVEECDVADADSRLRDALDGAERNRADVRLLGRHTAAAIARPRELWDWVHEHHLDGLNLTVSGGIEDTRVVLAGLASPPPGAAGLFGRLGFAR
jgi:alkanesulfonate monooxygenase SsuD/methylene tetrahydromethanopterin reductase-like flavin-dependent oxidoreductase (luciferase family)